jgi:hypothetical protein
MGPSAARAVSGLLAASGENEERQQPSHRLQAAPRRHRCDGARAVKAVRE